jgi:hypothetical protein
MPPALGGTAGAMFGFQVRATLHETVRERQMPPAPKSGARAKKSGPENRAADERLA